MSSFQKKLLLHSSPGYDVNICITNERVTRIFHKNYFNRRSIDYMKQRTHAPMRGLTASLTNFFFHRKNNIELYK